MTDTTPPARTASIAHQSAIGWAILTGLLLTSALAWGDGSNESTGITSILPALKEMPSFDQRDAEFKDGGLRYCGPTAAANGLMWLADQGYPNLRPVAGNDSLAQREMIKQLAALMGVHRDGSTSSGFLCGVKSYVRSMGYSPGTGHTSGRVASSGTRVPPDLTLLGESARNHTVVWLGLGIYRLEQTGKLRRTSGHLVTLAGITSLAPNSRQTAELLISDPEFPGKHVPVRLVKLEDNLRLAGGANTETKSFHTLMGWTDGPKSDGTAYRILESIQTLSLEPGL